MRLPYYVPGVPIGQEADDLERLEHLVRDIRAYARGELPSPRELEAAPVVEGWQPVVDTSAFRLLGLVSSHPTVGPGPAATSRIQAIDHGRRWMRTSSRLWRLGDPDPTRRTVQA